MAHKIIWSPQAIQDLRQIAEYISKHNPATAEPFCLSIMQKVELLANHPHIGRVVPEKGDGRIREVFLGPYRIIYRLRTAQSIADIMRVWHAARGAPEI